MKVNKRKVKGKAAIADGSLKINVGLWSVLSLVGRSKASFRPEAKQTRSFPFGKLAQPSQGTSFTTRTSTSN
jgi:hypothetical protein